MVTRPPDLSNRNACQEAALVLSLPLPRFKSRVFGLASEFGLCDNEWQQTLLPQIALQSFGLCSHVIGNRSLRQDGIPDLGRLAKRILDLAISSAALLVLWPLMLLIAIAVKLESRGPVIYASFRVGKNGVPFVCYKFRTMVPGANRLRRKLNHLNQRRGPFFKIANDPRVTPLGRFLRKYSLDELPQFWNVLKGDMSLVGPRPHPLEDVEQYSSGHEQRLEVIPGMTGLWQVTARENPSFETCMLLDVRYIRNWSLLLDCKILLRTIPAVLAGEGQ